MTFCLPCLNIYNSTTQTANHKGNFGLSDHICLCELTELSVYCKCNQWGENRFCRRSEPFCKKHLVWVLFECTCILFTKVDADRHCSALQLNVGLYLKSKALLRKKFSHHLLHHFFISQMGAHSCWLSSHLFSSSLM